MRRRVTVCGSGKWSASDKEVDLRVQKSRRNVDGPHLLPMFKLPSSSSGVAALKYFTKCSSCNSSRERREVISIQDRQGMLVTANHAYGIMMCMFIRCDISRDKEEIGLEHLSNRLFPSP